MRKIERLKREAKQAAEWRGHSMQPFKTLGCVAMSFCSTCNRSVIINPLLLLDEIEIGGMAVAFNCKEAWEMAAERLVRLHHQEIGESTYLRAAKQIGADMLTPGASLEAIVSAYNSKLAKLPGRKGEPMTVDRLLNFLRVDAKVPPAILQSAF